MLTNSKIDSIVIKIQGVYLFLICWEIFFFIMELLGSYSKYDRFQISRDFEDILRFVIQLTLYLGLKYRKKWVVPFVLLMSVSSIIIALLGILSPAESWQFILAKIFGVLFLLFYGYQLRFFTKAEVRKFFQSEGTVLF